MRRALFLTFVSVLGLASERARGDESPRIGAFGVRHGASFALAAPPAPLRAEGLARGAIFVVQGFGLGPEELVAGAPPFGLRLPDVGEGTEMRLRSLVTGEVVQARMVHAWNWQAAGIVPEEYPLGDAELTVWYRGRTSEPVRISIVRSSPGLFSRAGDGAGPGAILNYESEFEQPLNRFSRPARPGQHAIFWGTGLGDAAAADVRIAIGGEVLVPDYAGPAPGLPGVDQYNVRLPEVFPPRGCALDVFVFAGETASGSVTMAVTDSGEPCEHPWGLSPERLTALDAGERASWISLQLSDRQTLLPPGLGRPPGLQGVAIGFARSVRIEALPRQVSPLPALARPGGCAGTSGISIGGAILPGPVEPLPPPPSPPNPRLRPLDAGLEWALLSPWGESIRLERNVDGSAPPESYGPAFFEQGFLTEGVWKLGTPGGAEAPAFEAELRMPPMPRVTPPAELVRGADLQVEWPTEGFEEGDVVDVGVTVWTRGTGGARSEGVSCAAFARDGRLAIRLSAPDSPLAEADEADLSVAIHARPSAPPVQGLDRVELSATASRAWRIPVR